MNKKQIKLTWAAVVVFGLTLLAAPWTVTPAPMTTSNIATGERYSIPRSSYTANAPIWDGPYAGELNAGTLLLEWIGIGIGYGAIFFILGGEEKRPVNFGGN